ncbi:MAG: hypothetical protein Q4G07_04405 [Oscillospiraceae bacterium]|nr:hypothetical protein [Oscillospiraceae bacterium]
MKKMIAVCLVLICMTGLLAACDKQEAPAVDSGTRAPAVTEPDSPEVPDGPDEPEAPESWQEPDGGEEEVLYQAGSWDGNVYTNEYLGLTAEVGESWKIFDQEQMTQLNREAMEGMGYTDAQIEQVLKKQIYDTMFVEAETRSNIQVTVEDLYPNDFVTEETYLEITKAGLTENSGYDYEIGENKTIEIGGCEFLCFDAKVDASATQRTCAYHKGRYMICLIFTDMSGDEGGLDAMTSLFRPL